MFPKTLSRLACLLSARWICSEATSRGYIPCRPVTAILVISSFNLIRLQESLPSGNSRGPDDFRGPFLDASNAALARPEAEQPRLFIRFESDGSVVPWSKIAQLVARPDFPTMI